MREGKQDNSLSKMLKEAARGDMRLQSARGLLLSQISLILCDR